MHVELQQQAQLLNTNLGQKCAARPCAAPARFVDPNLPHIHGPNTSWPWLATGTLCFWAPTPCSAGAHLKQ